MPGFFLGRRPVAGAAAEADPHDPLRHGLRRAIVAVLVLAIAGAGAFMMMGKKKHADGEEAEEEVSTFPSCVITGGKGFEYTVM